MSDQARPLRDLVEAAAAPARPDRLGVILSGSIAGLLGALLHARGITLWQVPLVMVWLLGTAVVALQLLRLVLRHRDARQAGR